MIRRDECYPLYGYSNYELLRHSYACLLCVHEIGMKCCDSIYLMRITDKSTQLHEVVNKLHL